MSTHQLREALELATHVALINRGKLAYAGSRTGEMLDDPGWLYRHLWRGLIVCSDCLDYLIIPPTLIHNSEDVEMTRCPEASCSRAVDGSQPIESFHVPALPNPEVCRRLERATRRNATGA